MTEPRDYHVTTTKNIRKKYVHIMILMERCCLVPVTKLCGSPTVQHATSLCSHHDFDDTLLPRNRHETMRPTKMPPIYHVTFTWPVTWDANLLLHKI